MKEMIFTPEQSKVFKNYYFITENGIAKIGDSSGLTKENLKFLYLDEKHNFYELTAEDFKWYSPKEDRDFELTKPEYLVILRKEIPNEVLKILDQVMEERNNLPHS